MRKMYYSIVFLVLTFSVSAQDFPTERDAWLWPFSQFSIWNIPLGADAQFEIANFQKAGFVGVDVERLIVVKSTDPIRNIKEPTAWNQRWPGGNAIGSMRVPDDLIIPDATSTDTPNECSAFLQPDGHTIKQMEPTCRVMKASQIVGYPYNKDIDIYGEGIGGTHWGSGLSTLGGSIRKGELLGDAPIRHAIKWLVYGKKYLYFSASVKGYKWPADRSDSYASGNYGGLNPKLVQGTLLALQPDLDIVKLNLKTRAAKKIAQALKDYGAYICDDSGWDCYYIPMEYGVKEEILSTDKANLHSSSGDYFNDINKIAINLYMVTNNTASAIGGGGVKRAPLAPPFITTAVNTIKKSDFKLSYNSINKTLKLNSCDFKNELVLIEIYNILGNKIFEKQVQLENDYQMNVSSYSKGIYIVSLLAEGKRDSAKFIILE